MKRFKERFLPNQSTHRDRPDVNLNYYIRTCPHNPDIRPPAPLKGINAPIHFSDRVVAKWHRYSGHLLRLLESRNLLVPTVAGATVSTLLCFLFFNGTHRAQWTTASRLRSSENVDNVDQRNTDGNARLISPIPRLSLQEYFHQLVSSIPLSVSFPRSESEPEAEVTLAAHSRAKIASLASECMVACKKSWVEVLGKRLPWDPVSSSLVDGCQLTQVGSSLDAASQETSSVIYSKLPHQMNSLLAAPELCV